MNKKEAYSNIIQYKNNKRVEEESNELEHGFLSKFKAKYLEKIPLGNGKFRYVYEETKNKTKTTMSPKVSEKASANSLKSQARIAEYEFNNNPKKMAKEQESAARKAANEKINEDARINSDPKFQFAKKRIREDTTE